MEENGRSWLCGTDIGELLAHCMNDKNKMFHSLDSQSDRSPVNKSEKYLDGGEPLICRNAVNFVKNKKRLAPCLLSISGVCFVYGLLLI